MIATTLSPTSIWDWILFYLSHGMAIIFLFEIVLVGAGVFCLRYIKRCDISHKLSLTQIALGGLGLQTKNQDLGEGQFDDAAVLKLLAVFRRLPHYIGEYDSRDVNTGIKGAGGEEIDLNSTSSGHIRSMSDESSVKQSISNSGEKSL